LAVLLWDGARDRPRIRRIVTGLQQQNLPANDFGVFAVNQVTQDQTVYSHDHVCDDGSAEARTL
jgi:hypothetical protein